MARVVIEVSDGPARYRVAIQADSPRRALSVAGRMFSGGARVISPAIYEAVGSLERPAQAATQARREISLPLAS